MNRPLLSLKNRNAVKPSESVSKPVSGSDVVSSVVVQRKRRYVVPAPPKAILEAPEMPGPVVRAAITRKPKPITEAKPAKPVKPPQPKKPKVQPPPKPLPLPEIPRFVRVAVTLTALREAYPILFDEHDPRPWAVHIRKDLWKALKKKHSRCLIGDALQLWKNLHPAYLEKLKIAGTPRIDLDGNPKGVVTEEQANWMIQGKPEPESPQ